MSLYCYVQNNAVESGPRTLPTEWGGIVNFNLLSDPQLLTYGWYPYVETDAGSPGQYYDRIIGPFVINPTNVSRAITYTQQDIEAVRDQKTSDLHSNVPQYSAQALAEDGDRVYEIQDVSQWVKNRIVTLGALTTWNDVANFDTTLPDPIPLPNNYIGARQARQGERVFTEAKNRTEVGAPNGLSTEEQAWQLQNYAAQDDNSAATIPGDAPATIRQMINQPNELYGVVQVVRTYYPEEPDPNNQHGSKATMEREDAQDLFYVLYNSAGTYLSWMPFAEISPNVWVAETPAGALRNSSVVDFKFTLNYTTVTQFTNKIDMPASVNELTRKVRFNR